MFSWKFLICHRKLALSLLCHQKKMSIPSLSLDLNFHPVFVTPVGPSELTIECCTKRLFCPSSFSSTPSSYSFFSSQREPKAPSSSSPEGRPAEDSSATTMPRTVTCSHHGCTHLSSRHGCPLLATRLPCHPRPSPRRPLHPQQAHGLLCGGVGALPGSRISAAQCPQGQPAGGGRRLAVGGGDAAGPAVGGEEASGGTREGGRWVEGGG